MQNLIENVKEMILVACHAVFLKGLTGPETATKDTSYVGGYPGEGRFYVEHIKRGVQLAAQRPNSLLVISGQPTQASAGIRSEAESYLEVATEHEWWDAPFVRERTVLEEYARDSFENVLYSVARFRQATASWPIRVTTTGWKFKEERLRLHGRAIGWPAKDFCYEGVNDPEGKALRHAILSETRLIDEVKKDPLLIGTQFVAKRESRNPFRRRHPYRGLDSQLDKLFDFLERNVYTEGLPWL